MYAEERNARKIRVTDLEGRGPRTGHEYGTHRTSRKWEGSLPYRAGLRGGVGLVAARERAGQARGSMHIFNTGDGHLSIMT
jgi:hypothetical protein